MVFGIGIHSTFVRNAKYEIIWLIICFPRKRNYPCATFREIFNRNQYGGHIKRKKQFLVGVVEMASFWHLLELDATDNRLHCQCVYSTLVTTTTRRVYGDKVCSRSPHHVWNIGRLKTERVVRQRRVVSILRDLSGRQSWFFFLPSTLTLFSTV